MSLTQGTLQFYESWSQYLVSDVNLETDVFRAVLLTSSYVPNTSAHSVLTDLSGEVAGAGYDRQSLESVSVSRTAGVLKFDCDDLLFVATGGDWTARYYAIYNDTVSEKPLVCIGLIDSTNADVVVTDGNSLKVNINPQGLFRLQFQPSA